MKKSFIVLFINFCVLLISDGVEPVGSGTEADPYQVEILDNLLWISTTVYSVNKYYIQISDIDAEETTTWNDEEGFIPIGYYGNHFTGNYDGQDHIIYGLYINRPHSANQGLFGNVNGGEISNLNLVNADITGGYATGVLVGDNQYSTINNCSSSGNVNLLITSYSYPQGVAKIGGLIGIDYNSQIYDCSSSCNVYGDSDLGGLIGLSQVSFIGNCYSTGNVAVISETMGMTGGLIGDIHDTVISNCYSTSTVTGWGISGGLVGMNWGEINNCFSTGNVTGLDNIGGLVGFQDNGLVENCYSTGQVLGDSNLGGLIGFQQFNPVIVNSFWNIETSGQTSSAGGTGKNTLEMQDVATYTSLVTAGLNEAWDFIGNPFDDIGNEDFWDISTGVNDGYPFLTSVPLVSVSEYDIPNTYPSTVNLTNYPNPFNPSTTISFSATDLTSLLRSSGNTELAIYNILGRKVKTFPNQWITQSSDQHIIWNGDDSEGNSVSSGIYFCVLKSGRKILAAKKMMLMK